MTQLPELSPTGRVSAHRPAQDPIPKLLDAHLRKVMGVGHEHHTVKELSGPIPANVERHP